MQEDTGNRLLRGGTVVDGTGESEPYVADVAIREGQISAIGPDLDLKSGRVVDAAGHIFSTQARPVGQRPA